MMDDVHLTGGERPLPPQGEEPATTLNTCSLRLQRPTTRQYL